MKSQQLALAPRKGGPLANLLWKRHHEIAQHKQPLSDPTRVPPYLRNTGPLLEMR